MWDNFIFIHLFYLSIAKKRCIGEIFQFLSFMLLKSECTRHWRRLRANILDATCQGRARRRNANSALVISGSRIVIERPSITRRLTESVQKKSFIIRVAPFVRGLRSVQCDGLAVASNISAFEPADNFQIRKLNFSKAFRFSYLAFDALYSNLRNSVHGRKPIGRV